MNMIIQDVKAHIKNMHWADDLCSLNQIRKLIARSSRTITNNEDKIKRESTLQQHMKFFTQIGHLQ